MEGCGSDIIVVGGEVGSLIGDGPISISGILKGLVIKVVLKKRNRNENG